MVGNIIEMTFLVVIFGLILSHSGAFSAATQAVGSLYTGAVQTLAGVAGPGR